MNDITRQQALLACLAVGVLGAWVAWRYHRAVDSPTLKQLTQMSDTIRKTDAVRKAAWTTWSIRSKADLHTLLNRDGRLPEDETVLEWVRERTSDASARDASAPPSPPATMRPDGGIEFAYGTLFLKTAWVGEPRRKEPVVITILRPDDPSGATCVVVGLGREELVGGPAFQGRSWSEVRADVVDFEPGWPAPLDAVRTARFVPLDQVAYPWMSAAKRAAAGEPHPPNGLDTTTEPR